MLFDDQRGNIDQTYSAPSNVLHIQPRPVHPQPLLALRILRDDFIDLVPECIGVVEMMKMAEFVDNDVVDDCLWGHHALPVEGEVAAR